MISYDIHGLGKIRWTWFASPTDAQNVSEAVYFSYDDTLAPGFKKKKNLTTVIDLTETEEALWEGMREKFVRRQIRRGESAGITVRPASPEEFMRVYRHFRTESYLPRERIAEAVRHGMLMAAELKGEVLAAGLFIGDGTHARAYALASARFSDRGQRRELVGYANRILLWRAVLDLKRKGYRELDLGGIAPDSSDQHQRSLAEFKEAFGGARRMAFYYRKTYSPLLAAWRRVRSLV